ADKKHSTSDYTIEEILYSRELVDSHCARLAAQAGKEDLISQLEALHLSMEKAISENNVHGFY
ncbi:FCD domain-containing protein, partial [Citrobacter sp. TBCS-14]